MRCLRIDNKISSINPQDGISIPVAISYLCTLFSSFVGNEKIRLEIAIALLYLFLCVRFWHGATCAGLAIDDNGLNDFICRM